MGDVQSKEEGNLMYCLGKSAKKGYVFAELCESEEN